MVAISSFIGIMVGIFQHMLHFSFEGIFLIFSLAMVCHQMKSAFKIQACSKLELN